MLLPFAFLHVFSAILTSMQNAHFFWFLFALALLVPLTNINFIFKKFLIFGSVKKVSTNNTL